jgi:hypothetical protein
VFQKIFPKNTDSGHIPSKKLKVVLGHILKESKYIEGVADIKIF